jgi:hypothetical protein
MALGYLLSRGHLSVMDGITPEGKLYPMVQERAYRGEDVVPFLSHLGRRVSGKLLRLWEALPSTAAEGRRSISLELPPAGFTWSNS